MDTNTGRPTMLNSPNVSKTGLAQATNFDTEFLGLKFKSSSGLSLDSKDFVIGQRVYVGGNRPGQISYIGETHFAPGEWVGVVLDEPNGKNDGCVAGKRYFQCDPKRGIFSRINRLTLQPVLLKDNTSEIDFDSSRAVSPATSTRSGIPTKVSGLPSKRDLQTGDRVIVSSGFGSRPGELKYLGETKFAAGTWCGVQLDDQNGKNDGTVDGIRYFECPDKYGIFVPIAKVSLSPLAKMSNMSRMGSQESLTSVGTMNSIATTNTSRLRMSLLKGRRPSTSGGGMGHASTPLPKASNKNAFSLQDVLKERQNYIEQLITERELDREDVQSQTILFQKQISDLKDTITSIDIKLMEKTKKIEELKSSIDETQFCSDELTAQNQVYKEKINQLESKLVENSGTTSTTVREKCEKCPILLNDTEQLKLQIQKLLNELESMKLSNLNDKTIENLQETIIAKELEIKEYKFNLMENEKMRLQLIKTKEKLETEILTDSERHKDVIENINFKLDESNSKLDEILIENNQLKDLLEKKKNSQNEINENNENIEKLKNLIGDLQQQIKKHENNSSKNMKEINLKENLLKEQINQNDELQKEIFIINNDKIELIAEATKFQNELSVSRSDNENKNKELNNLQEKLTDSIKQCNEKIIQNNKIADINQTLGTDLLKTNTKLNEIENECVKLTQEKIMLENQVKNINENLTNENKINNEKTIQLNSKLNVTEKKINELIEDNAKLNNNLTEISDNNVKLHSEIKQLRTSYSTIECEINVKNIEISNLESTNKKLTDNIERNELELNEKNHTLQNIQEQLSQIKLDKSAIEIDLKNALENVHKTSIEKQKKISEKSVEIELLTKKLEEYVGRNNELDINLKISINDSLEKQQELTAIIQTQKIELELNAEKLNKYEKEIEENLIIINKLKDEYQLLSKKLTDTNDVYGKLKTNYSQLEIDLKSEEDRNELLNIKCTELETQKKDLQAKLINDNENLTMNAKTEINNLTESLVQKQKILDETEAKLNQLQMNLIKSEKSLDLQKIETERISQEHTEEKLNILNEIENLKKNLQKTKENYDILSREHLEYTELKSNEIHNTNETINRMKDELFKLNFDLETSAADSKLKEIKLFDEIKQLKDEKNNLLSNIDSLKKNIDSNELNNIKLQENLNLKENQLAAASENTSKISTDLKETIEINEKFMNEKFKEYQIQLEESKKLCETMEKEKEKFENMFENSNTEYLKLKEQYQKLQDHYNKINVDLEKLRNENNSLHENLCLDESKLTDTEKMIENFKTNIFDLENSNEKLTLEKINLSHENQTFKENLIEIEKNFTNKINDLNENLKLKEIEINELTVNFNNSNSIINDLKKEKKNLEEILNGKYEEFQKEKLELKIEFDLKIGEYEKLKSDLENVLGQNKDLNEIVLAEKTKLSQDLLKSESLVKAKDEEIIILKNIQNDIKNERHNLLEAKNLEIKNLLITLEALKTEMFKELKKQLDEKNDEIEILTKKLENIKTEYESNQSFTIKNVSEQYSTEIQNMKENLIKLELANEFLIKDNANLKDELLVSEHDKRDALNNIELFGVEHDQNFELIKENNQRLQKELDYLTALLNQKENDIIESKNMYEQINILLKDKNSTIAKLQIENNDLKKYEIKQKKDEISAAAAATIVTESSNDKIKNINNKNENNYEISFLNSIIADMQEKNEHLKSRIDLLENLGSSSVNMYMADFLAATTKKLPAPRLFCDICDEFDKHDTEDCPIQESDDIQDITPRPDTKNKVIPPARKYCESCEIFGHEKGECNNDECF